MSSELVPNSRLLMGDADRERVIARLNTAVGEGRLTLSEFEERMTGVLASRTFGEVEPYVADLPSGPVIPHSSTEPVELSVRGSSIRRDGPWIVPSSMRIKAAGSSTRLDFTKAVVTTSIVSIEVDLRGSSLRLIVPPGTTVDAGGTTLHGSSVRVRKVAEYAVPGQAGTHIVVTGNVYGSSIKAAPPRRWFWQRWFR